MANVSMLTASTNNAVIVTQNKKRKAEEAQIYNSNSYNEQSFNNEVGENAK